MSQKFNWPQPGCVGLWHFNRNMNDSSGYGNNASGLDITWPTAKFGLGANLNGVSSYMDISDHASLHTTQFTISVWYKGTDAGDISTIYSITGGYRGPTYYFNYGLVFAVCDGLLAIGTADMDYKFNYIYGTEVVNDGEWHWCAATPGKVYVDGQLVGSGSETTPGWYATHDVCIGARYEGGVATDILTGLVDELMLLNYALTDNQIQRAYLFQVGAL